MSMKVFFSARSRFLQPGTIEIRQGKHEIYNSEWEIIKLKFCKVNQGEISNKPKQYIFYTKIYESD